MLTRKIVAVILAGPLCLPLVAGAISCTRDTDSNMRYEYRDDDAGCPKRQDKETWDCGCNYGRIWWDDPHDTCY